MVNLLRGRECFVGLSILLVYGESSRSPLAGLWEGDILLDGLVLDNWEHIPLEIDTNWLQARVHILKLVSGFITHIDKIIIQKKKKKCAKVSLFSIKIAFVIS